jgi:hypothetical protein
MGNFLSSTAGAIIGIWITHFIGRQNTDREYRLKKLERLWMLMNTFVFSQINDCLVSMNSIKEHNLKIVNKTPEQEDEDVNAKEEAKMLIAIYFQDLRELFEQCEHVVHRVTNLKMEYNISDDPLKNDNAFKGFNESWKTLAKMRPLFQEAIARVADDIGSENVLTPFKRRLRSCWRACVAYIKSWDEFSP